MRWFWVIFLAIGLSAQQFPDLSKDDDIPARLPDGKLQTEAIIKSEHERSLKELSDLKKLIDEVYEEVEKSTQHVLAVQTVKKLTEIEKKAKKIRSRMTRN